MGITINQSAEKLRLFIKFKKLFPYALFAVLPIVLLRVCFYSSTHLSQPPAVQFHEKPSILIASSIFSSPPHNEDGKYDVAQCDYANGKWVPNKLGPLYNGTGCSTIKDGQNCVSHGRPDIGYLYWRWEPRKCKLGRFDPEAFLTFLRNKHLAFVGDSMARNQLESLLCMLASFSPPTLIYSNGNDNKFRRWSFPSHNVSMSVYWSPFLVKGVEKPEGKNHNQLYLDVVDERWASDLGLIDVVVFSIGHWYLHPAVYFEGDSILGCHHCPALNHTEIGFYGVFRKAFRTALKTTIQRKVANGNAIGVIVTTFSPHHFEGEWDKAGACPKTAPYDESEKPLGAMDEEMRRAGVEEVEAAKLSAEQQRHWGKVMVAALDVTKLAMLRPDGHPGPYMNPFPFESGAQRRVQNDCVHWCLPGAIDTWNEIMLEIMKGWQAQSRGGG